MTAVSSKPKVIAIAAHPDDIEYYMAGTLLMLADAGYETHYLNLSAGNCGSVEHDNDNTARIRRKEGQNAAKLLGATWHAPMCKDLEIFYDLRTLKKVSAVIRKVQPTIVLTHAPYDYMEDHMNTCRLAVTAAFTKGMPNFKSDPNRQTSNQDVAIYHAMPHGLRDPLRRRIIPGAYVNTTLVHETKLKSLAAHESQQGWLDVSQGMNSYLKSMDGFSRELGKMSGKFTHAEGWRRHLHMGFSAQDFDPLKDALKRDCKINKKYEKALEMGVELVGK